MRLAVLAVIVVAGVVEPSFAQNNRGDVTLKDGDTLRSCLILDHNPGPVGSGWDEKAIGFSKSLDAALKHDTNRSRQIQYSNIQRIDVLPLTSEEKDAVGKMDMYDKDKLIKADITLRDGSVMKAAYLLPHYLKYECANEKGNLTRETLKTVVFSGQK